MLKPICVPCKRFYRPKKNGVNFIEGMPKPGAVPARPGNDEPHKWQPYKLWTGDLWKCLGCGHEIIVGVAESPISEHYMTDFGDQVGRFRPTLQVNDC